MSLVLQCIGRLEATKRISKTQADRYRLEADRLEKSADPRMSAGEREAFVAATIGNIVTGAARERKRRAGLNAMAMTSAIDDMVSHPNGQGSGLNAILTRDIRGKKGGSIESRITALWEQSARKMDDAFENYTNRVGGLLPALRDIRNMIREGFGENTGDEAAKRAWAGWNEATSALVQRAKAGGKTFIDDDAWRFPQAWDARLVRRDRAAFAADIKDAAESGRLVVLSEDGIALGGLARDARIAEIVTKIGEDIGKGVDAPLNANARSLRFKDAGTWIALQSKYGLQESDLFSTLMAHLKGMATEVALIERLGPSYEANFRNLLERARAWENENEGKRSNVLWLDRARSAEKSFRVLTGQANAVENEVAASAMGATRALLSAAQLGSALLVSITSDSATALAGSLRSGVPAFRVLGRGFYDLFTDNASKRAAARQVGAVVDAIAEMGASGLRMADIDAAPRFASATASFVQRATLMQRWTRLMKRAFTLEFLGHMASLRNTAFADLPDVTREMLERHQLAGDWDRLRAATPMEMNGGTFLDLDSLDADLRERFVAALVDERVFAILEPDARVRGFTTGGIARGTFAGEGLRSVMQYKSFPITMMTTHLAHANSLGMKRGLAYVAGFGVALALAGAAGLQARQVTQGKEPRAMDNATFWRDAFFTGGALGILGDVMNTTYSRAGVPGFAANLAGPTVGLVENAAALVGASARETIEDGEAAKIGTQFSRFVRRYTPGSTIWYTRLITDRLIFDTLQKAIDPDYKKSFRRIEQRAKKDYAQEFWWRPGQLAPN